MFIGHHAVGFALKRAAPRTSLGALMAAPLLLDLLWPMFLLLGWEQVRIDPGNTPFTPFDFVSYPWSHSLLMAAAWGAAFGVLYFWRARLGTAAWWIAAGVVSHWVLDWLTHRPDMPLVPGGGAKVGLGLWSSIPATVAVEATLLVAAVWLYLAGTRNRDRVGRYGLWGFLLFVVAMYSAVVWQAAHGNPGPYPTVTQIASTGLAAWLFPLWAGWFDRHREARL